MFGIGGPELLVVFIIFFLFFPIWLSSFLRKRWPGKMWIGLIMSFVFAPLGQLYVEGAALWIIILFVCHYIFKTIIGDAAIAWMLS